MISDVFIKRPRLAAVISIVITLAGTRRAHADSDRAVPRHRAAADRGEGHLCGRQRRGGGGDRRAADRSAGDRRRQDALHEVDQRQRRQLHAHRHLRRRHQSRHQQRPGAEPRQPRRAAASRRGQGPGRQHQKEIVGAAPGRRAVVAGRPLRPAIPLQLRHHQHHRSAQAHRRHRRRRAVHALRLQHDGLAQHRPHDEFRVDAEGYFQRDRPPEHASGGRPHRRAARAARPAVPAQHLRPRAGSRRSRSSATSWCAPTRTARSSR